MRFRGTLGSSGLSGSSQLFVSCFSVKAGKRLTVSYKVSEGHMNILDITALSQVETVSNPPNNVVSNSYIERNKPVVIQDVSELFPHLSKWTLETIGTRVKTVKVQKVASDGIYHFLDFNWVSFDEFKENLVGDKNMYLSVNQIVGKNGVLPKDDNLRSLVEDLDLPPYMDKENLTNANLWIGPGGNSTLLHYDAWHSFIFLIEGQKEFAIYHPSQTKYLYPYKLHELRSLHKGKTMDSHVNPEDVQQAFVKNVSKAHGFRGILSPGRILFIPAGSWHYVKSWGQNIAVNFFFDAAGEGLWDENPLREYVIKTKYLIPAMNKVSLLKAYLKKLIPVGLSGGRQNSDH
jgi:hypothetical protein